jgi:mRNA interferase MazF
MLTSVEGVYRDGKIELLEQPTNIGDETRVIVTFLGSGHVDLRARGIDEVRAADLRARLQTFAEDWTALKWMHMTTTTAMPMAKRGDVVLVLFPNSNLQTAKRRPALVVQADQLQTGLSQLIVAMITSRVFRANHPSRVFIERATEEGQQSGLLSDSVIMTDNLATIEEIVIDRVIGSLPMAHIDTALRHTLAL